MKETNKLVAALGALIVAGVAWAETNAVATVDRPQIERAWYQVRHATNETERAEMLAILRRAAEACDHRAEALVGYCHETGTGCERNLDKAYEWYLRSAEGGRADAQMKVGYLTETAKNDITNAVVWYRRAAEGGDACAQCNLANCLRLGQGVEKDVDAALVWYLKSALQGDESAQYNLGVFCLKGEHCEKDESLAVQLFQESARRGHKGAADALKELGVEISPVATNGATQAVQSLEDIVLAATPKKEFAQGEAEQEEESEEDRKAAETAAEVSKLIRSYLDEFEVNYIYAPTCEVIRCTLETGMAMGQANLVMKCTGMIVCCYLIHPVRVPETLRDEMAKLLVRLNHDIVKHWYDMDYSDGEICLRATLEAEVIKEGGIDRFRKFLSKGSQVIEEGFEQIVSVALGIKTAEEVCRKPSEEDGEESGEESGEEPSQEAGQGEE